jgi:hypothetical protein
MKERRLVKIVRKDHSSRKYKQGVIYVPRRLIGCKVEVVYYIDDTSKPVKNW